MRECANTVENHLAKRPTAVGAGAGYVLKTSPRGSGRVRRINTHRHTHASTGGEGKDDHKKKTNRGVFPSKSQVRYLSRTIDERGAALRLRSGTIQITQRRTNRLARCNSPTLHPSPQGATRWKGEPLKLHSCREIPHRRGPQTSEAPPCVRGDMEWLEIPWWKP